MTALPISTRRTDPRLQRRSADQPRHAATRRVYGLATIALGLLISLAGTPSEAAGTDTKTAAAPSQSSAAQSRYQQERAVCLSGASHQDRATCLKEAGAARAEAQRGGLGDSTEPYTDNQRKRCAQLPGSQRQDCLSTCKARAMSAAAWRPVACCVKP